MKELTIRPLLHSDLDSVLALSDQLIGVAYYDSKKLNKLLKPSAHNDKTYSFVLENSNKEILGFRLSLPPGEWIKHEGFKTTPELWTVPADQVALFKTIFLKPEVRGQSWGPKLSEHSIKALKTTHTKAIVTYCWKDSPNNSSQNYLISLGFKKIKEHGNFWAHIDYDCTGCNKKPCDCTAIEMIKIL